MSSTPIQFHFGRKKLPALQISNVCFGLDAIRLLLPILRKSKIRQVGAEGISADGRWSILPIDQKATRLERKYTTGNSQTSTFESKLRLIGCNEQN